MSPALPPDLKPADRDDLQARYTVHSRVEILFLLRAMQERRVWVNLDLPGSRQIVVTSILAVDDVHNALILDSARGDALNHELMSSTGAEFIAQLDGVSISFVTGAVKLVDYENLPALRIDLPRSLVRLQRREHFRVTLPIARPVKCIVPPPEEGAQPITAHIADIGCGGVALADTCGCFGMETGGILPGCRLLLPEIDVVVATLEVRNAAQIRLHNGAFQTRLGCRFVDLPNDMAARLQRFVMDIERARRNTL